MRIHINEFEVVWSVSKIVVMLAHGRLQARMCLEIRNPCLKVRKSVLEILTMFHRCSATMQMSYFKAKMHQIRFEGPHSAPQDLLAGYKVSYFWGKGGKYRGGMGKGRKGTGRDPCSPNSLAGRRGPTSNGGEEGGGWGGRKGRGQRGDGRVRAWTFLRNISPWSSLSSSSSGARGASQLVTQSIHHTVNSSHNQLVTTTWLWQSQWQLPFKELGSLRDYWHWQLWFAFEQSL